MAVIHFYVLSCYVYILFQFRIPDRNMVARVSKRSQILPNKNMVARVSKKFLILPDSNMVARVSKRVPNLPNENLVARLSKKANSSSNYRIPNKNLIARVSKRLQIPDKKMDEKVTKRNLFKDQTTRIQYVRSFPQLGKDDHLEESVYTYNPIDERLQYVRTYPIFVENENRVVTGNNVVNNKLIVQGTVQKKYVCC